VKRFKKSIWFGKAMEKVSGDLGLESALTPSSELATCGLGEGEEEEGETQFHNLANRSTYYLSYVFRTSHLLTPSPELATCGLGEGEEEEGET
jgi:hypothetical protein